MFPLRPSATSKALFHHYGSLPPLQPSVLSIVLCLLCSPFPLYDPLSPLRPSVLSMALCLLNSPLSPLWTSVPSRALWKTAKKAKQPLLFHEMFCRMRFVKTPMVFTNHLFCNSDDRDNRDNHDYHSSEILSDNCAIAIIAWAKKVDLIWHIWDEGVVEQLVFFPGCT